MTGQGPGEGAARGPPQERRVWLDLDYRRGGKRPLGHLLFAPAIGRPSGRPQLFFQQTIPLSAAQGGVANVQKRRRGFQPVSLSFL